MPNLMKINLYEPHFSYSVQRHNSKWGMRKLMPCFLQHMSNNFTIDVNLFVEFKHTSHNSLKLLFFKIGTLYAS